MKTGRPNSISKSMESICINLAREGKLDREVAEILNVSVSTFHVYKNNNKEFYESYKLAKSEFDNQLIENALLKRASGMVIKETKTTIGANGEKTTTFYEREVPPDTQALTLYLRNRLPQIYCVEKQNINFQVEQQQGLSREEALQILRADPFAASVE